MSSHLQVLLEKINAKAEEVKPVEKPPESPHLQRLIQRLEAREWRKEMLKETIVRLCELSEELKLVRHIQKCRNCQLELSIDVIRHGGSHSGIWFVNLNDDDILPEIFPDCPPAKNYNMGSYWTGENHAEAVRFILDRAKWAEPLIREELYTAIDFYLALENWDFKSPLPPTTSNEELFGWAF